jgi:hypothetical protein
MKNVANSPILITGVQRSGATIIAKILQSCGMFTGVTTSMMENVAIKQLVDEYYADCGADKRGQFPLPDVNSLLIPTDWRDDVRFKLSSDGNWGYKSSRICQIWPVWNNAFPSARWIIVRRRTGDIINSCVNTDYMNVFEDSVNRKFINVHNAEEGWLWWIHEHEKLFLQIVQSHLNYVEVWPERMVNGDYDQIKKIVAWLGLEWDSNIPKKIEPLLWNSRQKKGD